MLTLGRDWTEFFRLSKREYFADFFITPPVTALMVGLSLYKGASLRWPLFFGLGVLAWTLYEYLMHRWGLHQVWGLRVLHAMHHKNDRDYIATHPAITVAAYIGFWFMFGVTSSAFAAGFSAGYVIYAAMHTLYHYTTILPGDWLFGLKRRHALHHRFETYNFGVSTPLWDIVFQTSYQQGK